MSMIVMLFSLQISHYLLTIVSKSYLSI